MQQRRNAVSAEPPPGQLVLGVYFGAVSRYWKPVAVATVVAVVSAALLTEFVLRRWYRATTWIRPSAQSLETGSTLLSGAASGLGSLFQLNDAAAAEAQRFISILTSYAFTNSILDRYNLSPASLGFANLDRSIPEAERKWRFCKRMKQLLRCSYDQQTGNITITFDARDRETAVRILGYYIASLREKLIREKVDKSRAAAASLEAEISKTGDPAIQADLEEMIAHEIQTEKLAQADANFAFTIIDPPFSPFEPYRPVLWVNCLLAGALAFVGSILVITALRALNPRFS